MFCSGADLKFIRDGGDGGDLGYLAPGAARGGYGERFKQILEYIHSTHLRDPPRAEAVHRRGRRRRRAPADSASRCRCDLVLASTRASFEWAYPKTGLTGAESSTFLLPRLIGLRRAMELMLLNPRLGATQALEYGLITAVYDVERFDDEVARDRRAARGRAAAGVRRRQGAAEPGGGDAIGSTCTSIASSRSWRASPTVRSSPRGSHAFFDEAAADIRLGRQDDARVQHRPGAVRSDSATRPARAARSRCGACACRSARSPASTSELLRTAYDLFRVRTHLRRARRSRSKRSRRDGRCPDGHGDIVTRAARSSARRCGRPARLAAGDEIVLHNSNWRCRDV